MLIGVLGAGSMGHGIAQVAAMGGHEVVVRDVDDELLEDGIAQIKSNLDGAVERDKLTAPEAESILEQISGTTSLETATADRDIIIEAVPEEMDIKKAVFSDVEKSAPADAILATNTSSLSVTEIASAVEDPSRVIGLHFFNPVHLMDLVEIVVAEQTTEDVLRASTEFVRGIDKEPVTVRDSAGFATSRLNIIYAGEAMRMVETGVASIEDIDKAMELGFNHPMGPLELADLTGLDVNLHVHEYLREELGDRFRPPQILKQKVRAGNYGRKTGEGFYVWEDGEAVRPSETGAR